MYKYLFILFIILTSCSKDHPLEYQEKLSDSAFRPSFITNVGDITAGSIFIVLYHGAFYAVTAHHLFGSAGGLSREYSSEELGKLVRKVKLRSLDDNRLNYTASEPIAIKGAEPFSEETAARDIAIFKLDQMPTNSLFISTTAPRLGESVWMYTSVINRDRSKQLFKAVVVEYNKDRIVYAFEDSGIELNATSGAAVINWQGDVVGINLGGGRQGRVLFGIGNPLSALQETFENYVE